MGRVAKTFEPLPFLSSGGRIIRYYRDLADSLGIPSAGWIGYPTEAQALYDLASVTPGPIVEVGTYLGLSTCFLALPGRAAVVTIDPHDDALRNATQLQHVGGRNTAALAEEAWSTLGLDDRIRQTIGTSERAAVLPSLPKRWGLAFIDGDHSVAGCTRDIETWAPRIMPGGYLALHDWGVRGDDAEAWDVAGCAARLLPASAWLGPIVAGSIAWYQRREATNAAID